jgi:predicted ATPase
MGDTESLPQRTSIGAFVGRERELAELHAGVDDSVAGRGRLFLVSGEPGIGKTRLAEEISKDSAAGGMRVVWGRCWEGAARRPIGHWFRCCAHWSKVFVPTIWSQSSDLTPARSREWFRSCTQNRRRNLQWLAWTRTGVNLA